MRRSLVLLFVLLLVPVAGGAGTFEASETVDGVTVKVSMAHDPPVIGKNDTGVLLVDEQDNAITDAETEIYYFMPSMPAMNYTAKAGLTEGKYRAVLDLVMGGSWQLDVKFTRPNSEEKKVSVTVNVK